MTFTVMIMEPCCELTEPGYDPGPRPVWNRTPGAWPPRCLHKDTRVPTYTTHETREAAEAEFGKTRGWGALDGYLYEGGMPPEGERFRLVRVGGNGVHGHIHGNPSDAVFPTMEAARKYGERGARGSLLNVVGDRDMRVRWSSYGLPAGTEIEPGQPA